jgi:uncharacterized protein YuzE
MKFSYDPRYNIAYLRFHKKSNQVETIKVSDSLNIDLAPDGTIYGIELLNANEQLKDEDLNSFKVINEATGKEIDIPIALSS